jgi:hypothetical protein
MTTRKTFLIAALTILAALHGREMPAQSLELTLARLRTSQTDTAKENALYDLLNLGVKEQFPVCSPSADRQIRRALIVALEKENNLVNSGAGPFSETEMEYYANVIGCVASLRDRTALRSLIGALETGWGAINGVVALGETAVPNLVDLMRATTTKVTRRHAAVHATRKLLERQGSVPISAASLAVIRSGLLASLGDSSPFVRRVAIEALAFYSDPDVRQAVVAIANTDSATVDRGDGKKGYPVRQAAQDWLKQDSLKIRKRSQ